ncbi:MAG: hypothetical protein F9K32_14190 [Desulfobulbaceae bacterium]|nr:MAG: hypothetical protein F9K32_14190 [Desulfobulbaceae bacterium]
MKRIMCIVGVVLCCASLGYADEWEGLSLQAKERIQLQARQMSEAGIPEEQARTMLLMMLRNRFEEQTMIRARRMLMDTADAGLPTRPVMAKAMEGMAKQMREQKIISAMETVRNRYALSRQLADSLTKDSTVSDTLSQAVADSLAAGMRTEDLEQVRAQLQIQTRQQTRNRAESDELAIQTMQAVRTMARMGASSGEVADTLDRALRNRYTHQEMHQLRHLLASPSQTGSPVETANRHASSLGKGGATDLTRDFTSEDNRSPGGGGSGNGGSQGSDGSSGSGGASGGGSSGGKGSSGSSGSSGNSGSSGGNGPGGHGSGGNGHGSQGSR